jgi:hypothetical protein
VNRAAGDGGRALFASFPPIVKTAGAKKNENFFRWIFRRSSKDSEKVMEQFSQPLVTLGGRCTLRASLRTSVLGATDRRRSPPRRITPAATR